MSLPRSHPLRSLAQADHHSHVGLGHRRLDATAVAHRAARHHQFDAVMASLRNLYGNTNVSPPKTAISTEAMDSGLGLQHVQCTASGLDITVQFSKTSRAPARVSLAARKDALCPVQAFRHYREFLARLRLPTGPSDPLFVHCVLKPATNGP